MGFGSRALLAGGVGFAAAFLVACGGSNDLLSGGQSSTLASQLDAVSTAVSSGNCGAATRAADRFTSEVGSLTSPVSSKLVQSLGDGAVKLKQLAARDCSSTSSSSSHSTTASSTTTSSPSTTTTTVTETSTPTPTSTHETLTGTATKGPGPGTSSTVPSGGAGLGGTGTNGNGGAGQ